ncbi:uncharacterized protein LOC106611916 [Tachysurus ichikawai]
MHLHRFLWGDTEVGKIEEYAITRVNIGDRPAGCIAQLAMRETAKLPMFADLEEERRILEEDTYVDDILTSHNDLQKLDQNIKLVEEMLKASGFFKPWVQSGQSGRQEIVPGEQGAESNTVFILPNQMREGDNKVLGVGYFVEEDKLYLMTSINFSKRKKQMRVGQNLLNEEVRGKTPNPLTRRELLSQVAGLYDPIDLVTPAKQKGAILVRKAFQEAGGKTLTRDTWDKPLSEKLVVDPRKPECRHHNKRSSSRRPPGRFHVAELARVAAATYRRLATAKEVAAYAKEGLDKLQRKSFSAALTRAQAKRNKGDVLPEVGVQKKESQSVVQQNGQDNLDKLKTLIRRPPAGSAVTKLIDIRKFSSLTKLIRVIAWVWRAATRWKEMLIKNTASDKPKWEKILSTNRGNQAVLTAGECEDALRDLFLAAQEGQTFQNTTLNRLSVYRDEETGLLVCGGR